LPERVEALAAWYGAASGTAPPRLELAAGDASFRKYYRRVGAGGPSVILCDAPPETEKSAEFVTIARALDAAGVRVPRVLHADVNRGFLALEDLGDQTLLPLLGQNSVEAFYRAAMKMLETLAAMTPAGLGLRHYDRAHLLSEMDLFPDWFCAGLLGAPMTASERTLFARLEAALCDRALAQRQVVVHRDFHARNLMVLADGTLATIDFQDAVIGPLTYDPVSLLRDCYIRWPREDVHRWVLGHRDNLQGVGLDVPAADEFLTDFDWMGLQRHIKVLGIFARLYQRDGKPGYLPDLPRVMTYVRETLASYSGEPDLAEFATWFEEAIVPRAVAQPWYDVAREGPA